MSDDTEVSLDDLVGRTLTEVVAALKLTHCVPATRSESGMLATDGPEERIWNDDGLTVTLIERLWGVGAVAIPPRGRHRRRLERHGRTLFRAMTNTPPRATDGPQPGAKTDAGP